MLKYQYNGASLFLYMSASTSNDLDDMTRISVGNDLSLILKPTLGPVIFYDL
jgi:hypothetical protein